MQKITVGEQDAGQRLDKYLQKILKEADKGFLYKMLRKKNITLNGRKAEGSEKLASGDEVCFFLLWNTSKSISPDRALWKAWRFPWERQTVWIGTPAGWSRPERH